MKWNIRGSRSFKPFLDARKAKFKKLGMGNVLAEVLANRGVSYDNIYNLFKDPGKLTGRPIDMAGCRDAGEAIADMVECHRNIYVFADYDVDGLTAGYIMSMFLHDIGATVQVFYPERKDGYGLSLEFVKRLQKKDAVITVDNGITANEAVQYCVDHNIPVVVTDHHEPVGQLPNCPICDPHIDKNGYGHHLCGAAVAYKVCHYIGNILGRGDVLQYLPYVAIGTVADVMPMVPENQAIVSIGIKMIEDGYAKNIGSLVEALKIPKLTGEEIAWRIGPELNACSRLGNTNLAGEFLFFEGTKKDLQKLILQIDSLNEFRKTLTKEAITVASQIDYSKDYVCFFDATDYPLGLSGVIANRIMDTFNKPTIVYVRNKGTIWPGSLRSQFNILPLLEEEKETGHIVNYGGHANACGLSLLSDIDTFKRSLNNKVKTLIESGDFKTEEPVLNIDSVISLTDITNKNLIEVTSIPSDKEVFPAPMFMINNLRVANIRYSGNNPDNICFTFVDEAGNSKDIWAWHKSDEYASLGSPKYLDIVGTMRWGFGKDSDKVTFNVEGLRCSC